MIQNCMDYSFKKKTLQSFQTPREKHNLEKHDFSRYFLKETGKNLANMEPNGIILLTAQA